jgi:hypothetical protein
MFKFKIWFLKNCSDFETVHIRKKQEKRKKKVKTSQKTATEKNSRKPNKI